MTFGKEKGSVHEMLRVDSKADVRMREKSFREPLPTAPTQGLVVGVGAAWKVCVS